VKSKFKGSIQLSAIGDAMGWMTEFERDANGLNKKFGVERIEKFYNWEKQVGGRYYGFIDKILAGSYSDDTQLTLSVARSIRDDGTIDNERFSKLELHNWLYYARGGGRTVKVAARKINRKSASWNNNYFNFKIGQNNIDYRDCGANGAAMRILPVALANIGVFEKMKAGIISNAIITHGHARAIIGAIIYGAAIDLIIHYTKEDFDPIDFLTDLGKTIREKLALNKNENDWLNDWIEKWGTGWLFDFESHYESIIEEVLGQMRGLFIALRDETPYPKLLSDLGCYKPETKGSGTATVLAGIFLAIKFYKKPKDAILNAVNSVGTDTDSIAAFTGGIIGAIYGDDIIPEEWKNIQDIDYLEKMAEHLYNINKGDYNSHDSIVMGSAYKTINDFEMDELNKDDPFFFEPIGLGTITGIERQPVLISGKYALIVDIDFESGQTCRFSKACNEKDGAASF